MHDQCNKLIEELRADKIRLQCEKDELSGRLKRKEDYWAHLYMKMFTAAEKNESLQEVFRAECASMRS
jgi:hypothetical protein